MQDINDLLCLMHFSGWCCTTNDLTQLKSAKIARGEVIWDISFTPPSLRCYWKLQTSLSSPFAYFMELFMTDQLISIFYKVTFWISLIPLVFKNLKVLLIFFTWNEDWLLVGLTFWYLGILKSNRFMLKLKTPWKSFPLLFYLFRKMH